MCLLGDGHYWVKHNLQRVAAGLQQAADGNEEAPVCRGEVEAEIPGVRTSSEFKKCEAVLQCVS